MSHGRVAEIAAQADRLPSLPAVVSRLIALMADDRLGIETLAHQVEADPAIVARVLAAANAGAYGSQHISAVTQAVQLLGVDRVRDIAINNALLEVFAVRVPECMSSLWLESLASAVCAEEVAAQLGVNKSIAYVSGLLHDIGKLLLYVVLGEAYEAVLIEHQHGDVPLAELERARLGVDHAAVGAALASAWHLPAVVVDSILGHTDALGPDVVRSEMADVVHIGMVLARALDLAGNPRNRVPQLSDMACLRSGLHWGQCRAALPHIEGRFAHVRSLLRH